MEFRTETGSELSLLVRRTFLMERLAGGRSCAPAAAGVDAGIEGLGALSGVRGLEMDSNTR